MNLKYTILTACAVTLLVLWITRIDPAFDADDPVIPADISDLYLQSGAGE